MRGKIILEEHVCMPEDNAAVALGAVCRNPKDLEAALLDVYEHRLLEMNANGVEHAVLSQNSPGAQGVRSAIEAAAYATRANDYIATLVQKAPERFSAFAALSMHDPAQAVGELRRCVNGLGMVGVLLNDAQEYTSADGNIEAYYYDESKYDKFWAAVQELDVPVYLHPKGPLPREFHLYQKRPWLLGPTWSFARDTGFHAMAICTSGVFDRFPKVRLILGHMGEMIIGHLSRSDYWFEKRDRGRSLPCKQRLRYYFNVNVFITTAGYFSTPVLLHAMLELGVGQILFSVDTPYANITEASEWFDATCIADADRKRIGQDNALHLIKKLAPRLQSSKVALLQQNREPMLFKPNPGFEPTMGLQ